jgi:hypothetical protein
MPLNLQCIGHRGACIKPRIVPHNRRPKRQKLLAGVSVPLVPIGQPMRLPVIGAKPPSAVDLPPHAPSWSPPGSTPSPRRPRNEMRRSRPA